MRSLGNPPWEQIELKEQEFFAARDPESLPAPRRKAAKDAHRSLSSECDPR